MIGSDDTLGVYRQSPKHKYSEVGKIRIFSYIGAFYLKAEVIAATLKSGDIAKKRGVAILAISPAEVCGP